MALTSSAIQILFKLNPASAIVFDFEKALPFRPEFFWKSVRKPESDELDEARFVAMGQISFFVPPEKCICVVLASKWTRPRAFVLHEVANAGIIRR